jgi:regulator of protease activity HflC (stomatin/prohibitin superfamily)
LAELDLAILGGQILLGIIIAAIILSGIRIIRPTHRAAIETLGKYTRFQKSGITFIIPFIQKLYSVNITEQLVDVLRQ